jgi:hypothetical protein
MAKPSNGVSNAQDIRDLTARSASRIKPTYVVRELCVLVGGLAAIGIFDVILQYLRSCTLSHTTNRIDVELGQRLMQGRWVRAGRAPSNMSASFDRNVSFGGANDGQQPPVRVSLPTLDQGCWMRATAHAWRTAASTQKC